MKKVLLAAAAVMVLPAIAEAQDVQMPGVYIGVEGGLNWMFNSTILGVRTSRRRRDGHWAARSVTTCSAHASKSKVSIARTRPASSSATAPSTARSAKSRLWPTSCTTSTPRAPSCPISAPAPASGSLISTPISAVRCLLTRASSVPATTSARTFGSTSKAAIIGTTNPTVAGSAGATTTSACSASIQVKFGSAPPPPPPPPPMVAPPSFMVFFDWDRSNLSQQALTTIQQAADAFKTKGNARITATGHTDTSGPESLQHGAVAASCQRGQGRSGPRRRAGRRRSRSSARARASCWCRPATTCASRRTAASRSSSSRTIHVPGTSGNGRAQPGRFFARSGPAGPRSA